jgi:hypothetical protein
VPSVSDPSISIERITLTRPLLLLTAVLAASGCGGQPTANTIPRDTFVAVNVALRMIPDTVADPDSARLAVLEEHGVDGDDLHAFVAAHGGDVEALALAWRQVATRLDSLQQPADPEAIDGEAWEEADRLEQSFDDPAVKLPPEMDLPHLDPPPPAPSGARPRRVDPPMRQAPPVTRTGEIPLPRPPAPMEVVEDEPRPPKP